MTAEAKLRKHFTDLLHAYQDAKVQLIHEFEINFSKAETELKEECTKRQTIYNRLFRQAKKEILWHSDNDPRE